MALPPEIQEPLHPSGRPLSDFERRLCRLSLIGHEAHLLICSAIRTEDRKRDVDLMFTLQHYALILICRFLEIWGQFQSLAKDNRRVLEITRAMSVYVDRIRIWPGLEQYRNWIIAHGYRIGSNPELVLPWTVINTGRVPSHAAEWLLLLECGRFAVAGVLAYYGDILRVLNPVLDPGPDPEIEQGVQDGAAAQAARIEMATEGNRRLEELGVDLHDPVFQRFKCRPPGDSALTNSEGV